MPMSQKALLGEDDPKPVKVLNESGRSPIVLTCEHAGREIPRSLGDLGLHADERGRHIAWDVGAENVARLMSEILDAVLIVQRFSRLVIDCNRPPDAPDFIPAVSDGTEIPGNANLSDIQKHERRDEIHRPYHERIAGILDRRSSQPTPPLLVSVHSFTPRMNGFDRPWDLGLLFNRDRRLAEATRRGLTALDQSVRIAFNEPYAVSDISDFTIPVHGEKRGIAHVLIEIRNDHLQSKDGQEFWAERLCLALETTLAASPGYGE